MYYQMCPHVVPVPRLPSFFCPPRLFQDECFLSARTNSAFDRPKKVIDGRNPNALQYDPYAAWNSAPNTPLSTWRPIRPHGCGERVSATAGRQGVRESALRWPPVCSLLLVPCLVNELAASAAWRPPSARRRVQQPKFRDSDQRPKTGCVGREPTPAAPRKAGFLKEV
jgi:hypothetical protein